ncbi:MAG TPA: hypothetical protein PLE51_00530 [Candidatus Pacearchaeota archaeon]|nr:hypothetical protein [Candidatus Pacearchaeota archaeon]HOR52133.1 hypothetical protein [Candidatus Pacearchaeota archaeon]HOU78958.1 hypothetical protein [Candidatus Pacearchaeota archaeon]HPJ86529.1 hypothetical protein [Candidatus Pacearchaeota archaeon]HQF82694.1 hypothetical protein [Candidatus Pacearchaeota archaeon]
MNREELIKKITTKNDFSELPKQDVELAFNKFNRPHYSDEEKVKLTRDLLRKVFSVFTSGKLLNIKDKDCEWILNKHISTRERLKFYPEVYHRIFSDSSLDKVNKRVDLTVIDLGAGVNGFSYKYFPKNINYLGVEGMNQLVNLTNHYFNRENIKGKVIQESLFNLDKIKGLILKVKGLKILFLFKVIDSLEMLQDNYSKSLIKELTPLVDFVVISFATRSLVKRERFKVNRKWILKFIEENFEVLEDFEIGNERYIKFRSRFK